MSEAPDAGWLSLQTIGLTILAVLLIAAFFVKETRTDAPLVPLGLFRVRHVFVANARRLLHRRDDLRRLLPAHALHAGGARLLGARGGDRVPRHRRHDHPGGRHRAGARDTRRREARDGGGPRLHRVRIPLVHTAPARRRVLAEPLRPLRRERLRARLRLHPRLARGAREPRGADRRGGVGTAEHVAADRRRARRGDRLDGRDPAHRDAARRGREPGRGLDRGLQLGLLGRRDLRDPRPPRRGADPAAQRRAGNDGRGARRRARLTTRPSAPSSRAGRAGPA